MLVLTVCCRCPPWQVLHTYVCVCACVCVCVFACLRVCVRARTHTHTLTHSHSHSHSHIHRQRHRNSHIDTHRDCVKVAFIGGIYCHHRNYLSTPITHIIHARTRARAYFYVHTIPLMGYESSMDSGHYSAYIRKGDDW